MLIMEMLYQRDVPLLSSFFISLSLLSVFFIYLFIYFLNFDYVHP